MTEEQEKAVQGLQRQYSEFTQHLQAISDRVTDIESTTSSLVGTVETVQSLQSQLNKSEKKIRDVEQSGTALAGRVEAIEAIKNSLTLKLELSKESEKSCKERFLKCCTWFSDKVLGGVLVGVLLGGAAWGLFPILFAAKSEVVMVMRDHVEDRETGDSSVKLVVTELFLVNGSRENYPPGKAKILGKVMVHVALRKDARQFMLPQSSDRPGDSEVLRVWFFGKPGVVKINGQSGTVDRNKVLWTYGSDPSTLELEVASIDAASTLSFRLEGSVQKSQELPPMGTVVPVEIRWAKWTR
ncbi:MAG: hypothetical protein HYY17_13175 [Planctomycetes bacterium]|nr:hypothetical protein [Planctomycetota bacterium]